MKGKVFNAQEVQAIIAGNKTQFREVIKPQPETTTNFSRAEFGVCNKFHLIKKPYQVGQKIFCKESFFEELHPDLLQATGKICYAATCDEEVIKVDGDGWQLFRKNGDPASPWKPAQHMKQEHSRLTLLIKEIRVERLGDISEEDAIAEGVFKSKDYWHSTLHPIKGTYQCWTSAKEAFEKLWNATHKKPEEKFEANPWVWCVLYTPESELLDWKDLLGIAPNATGGLSSEEFVRNLRNEWQ